MARIQIQGDKEFSGNIKGLKEGLSKNINKIESGFVTRKFITLKLSKMIRILLSVLIVAISSGIVASNEENEITLEIKPGNQQLQVGKDFRFECEPSDGDLNITWLLPNQQKANMSEEKRIYQMSGTLQIKRATVNDSGIYTCISEHMQYNATVQLVVYLMSDFYFESMIIVGVNCSLVVLFFLCYLYTIIYRRWRTKNNKENTTHRI